MGRNFPGGAAEAACAGSAGTTHSALLPPPSPAAAEEARAALSTIQRQRPTRTSRGTLLALLRGDEADRLLSYHALRVNITSSDIAYKEHTYKAKAEEVNISLET